MMIETSTNRPSRGANDMTIRKRPASEGGGEESRKGKKLKKKDRSYGTLFKKAGASASPNVASQGSAARSSPVNEESNEYWNDQRAKLGLKPLQNKWQLQG
jgi:hypothetical protein